MERTVFEKIGGDELKSGLSGQDTVGAVQITIATRSETLF
jgi:hypothetical protein